MAQPVRQIARVPVKSCESCAYFTEQSETLGLCRKNPPTVVVVEIAKPTDDKYTRPFTTWPLVRNFDWCGDHAYKG